MERQGRVDVCRGVEIAGRAYLISPQRVAAWSAAPRKRIRIFFCNAMATVVPEFGKTVLAKDIGPLEEKSYEATPANLITGLSLTAPWNLFMFWSLPHKLHVKDDTIKQTSLVSGL